MLPNYHVEKILDRNGMNNLEINKEENYTLIHLAAVYFDFQKKFFETNVIRSSFLDHLKLGSSLGWLKPNLLCGGFSIFNK